MDPKAKIQRLTCKAERDGMETVDGVASEPRTQKTTPHDFVHIESSRCFSGCQHGLANFVVIVGIVAENFPMVDDLHNLPEVKWTL